MLFNTVQFFLFLPVVVALFYWGPRVARKPLLLAASYFFYACWNPRFVPLLATLTVIDYGAGIWMGRVRQERRRAALAVSIGANLVFLSYFKYFNFLAGNFALLVGRPAEAFALDILLPLGISFHTLQSLSYVVDVYRREQKPITNFLDYALFIAFFPQLVAGPIVRAHVFFRDLYNWRPTTSEDRASGVLLIALGLTKKMAFADQFAQISDTYFKQVAGQPGLLTAWSASIAFILQVYFDFSGYTDIAIGSAKLLGFHFPANFNRPFLAGSLTELWRRWHISFSKWLRDYIYSSLAAGRRGELAVFRNLMLTMMAGGLWHGASWNFVLWGAYHGGLLSVERAWRVWRRNRGHAPRRAPAWLHPCQVVATFLLFALGAPFFRARTVGDAIHTIGQMFTSVPGAVLFNAWQIGLAVAALVAAAAEEKWGWFERLVRGPVWAYAGGLALLLLTLELFGATELSLPFVYFQF